MSARRPPTWPVIPLALPAAVSIWAGWVGLGQLTGFGVVQLLPGIWDGLRINTAVTLPVGMEAYAAFALYVWLHRGTPRPARDFARVSSIVALTLGALGQVAYHLMAAAGVTSAPWPITAAVACLPVGVLGMGATLAHLLSTEPDDEPAPSNANRGSYSEHVTNLPQSRPAMSAPPAGPGSGNFPPPTEPSRTVPLGVSPVDAGVPGWTRPGHQAPLDRPPVDPSPTRSTTPRPPVDQESPGASATTGANATHVSHLREPSAPDDPVVEQVAALVAASPPGRPPGRRTVARELDVTEYRAGQLLAQVTNHNGTAPKGGHR